MIQSSSTTITIQWLINQNLDEDEAKERKWV
jgi:hypothetical protein